MLWFPSMSQDRREPSLFQPRGIVRAEQGTAADAFQRPLRFRFQARLKPSVRRLSKQQFSANKYGSGHIILRGK